MLNLSVLLILNSSKRVSHGTLFYICWLLHIYDTYDCFNKVYFKKIEETKLKLTQRNMPTLVTALTLTDVTLSTFSGHNLTVIELLLVSWFNSS